MHSVFFNVVLPTNDGIASKIDPNQTFSELKRLSSKKVDITGLTNVFFPPMFNINKSLKGETT